MHSAPVQEPSSVAVSAPDLASDSCETIDIDRLGDAIAEAAAQIDAASHRLLQMIRTFDACGGYARHGARSTAHWLSWRIGLLPGAARERVRVARALGDLPLMNESLRRGELSYSKVRAMTRVATAQNEARLVAMARETTGAELEKICRGLRGVLAAADSSDDRQRIERWVRHRTTDTGMVRLEAQLHPDEAAMVLKALAEARRHATDVPAGTCDTASLPPMQPDFGSRQADALLSIADSFLAHGAKQPARYRAGAERTQLFVHLSPSRLNPDSHLDATLQDGTSLSSATLLRLACDTGLVTIRTGDDGEVLDVGRRSRSIPAHINRALRARDRTCRFPGCTATSFVDAHHVEHWAQGGETKLSNLLTLCGTHHTAVHEGGFRVVTEDGAFAFYTPDGRQLPRVPRAPGVPAETLELLRARHAAGGLRIDSEIQLGSFRLEALDYDQAVTALLPCLRNTLRTPGRYVYQKTSPPPSTS